MNNALRLTATANKTADCKSYPNIIYENYNKR